MLKATMMSGLYRSSQNKEFRNFLIWPEKVLCTPQTTKTQIISDLVFSMYEFLETQSIENLRLSLYAAKHSEYNFMETIHLDEPFISPNYGAVRMYLYFINGKQEIDLSIKISKYSLITIKSSLEKDYGNNELKKIYLSLVEISEMYRGL